MHQKKARTFLAEFSSSAPVIAVQRHLLLHLVSILSANGWGIPVSLLCKPAEGFYEPTVWRPDWVKPLGGGGRCKFRTCDPRSVSAMLYP